MAKRNMQQKGERRIAAALRIAMVAMLILFQVAMVILASLFLQRHFVVIYTVLEIAALLTVLHIYNKPGSLDYKFAWVVVILFVPVAGFIFYALWGGNTQRKRMMAKELRLREEPESTRMRSEMNLDKLAASRPDWIGVARYLYRQGFQLYGSTDVRYFAEGQDMLEDMIAKIECAEHFIFLEFFIIAEGRLWDRIFAALRERAEAGVEIKVIFDDFGNIKRFRGDTIDAMREAGIEVAIFNPVHEYVNRLYLNYRDHRKIVVIDGHFAYTGGVNIADEYANLIERFGYWKDSGILLEGEGAWGLTKHFIHMWKVLDGAVQNDEDYYRPQHVSVKGGGFCQPFVDGPQNNPDDPAQSVYLQMISRAKHFLYITTPYFIPDDSMMRALCIAGDSGVDVRLMLPGVPDHWYADTVAESHFGVLLNHGVKVYRYTPGILHAKSVMVDREVAFVGTVNMDYRSFSLHYEDGVMLYGVPMIEDLLEDMDNICAQSRQVTLEDWKGRGRMRRLMEPLLRLFSIWM